MAEQDSLRTMRINEARRPANGRRSRGRPFKPGQSGNPGGRPKGSKTYAIRELVAQALADPATREAAIAEFRRALTRSKSVILAMEFAGESEPRDRPRR